MASPNIVSPTTITLKSFATTLSSTATALASCSADKSVKVSSVAFSNLSNTACGVTLRFNNGSATNAICLSISLPTAASLLPVTRENPVYLQEGESIEALCSPSGAVDAVVSYEEIS
jgi:hypothetical protein